MHPPPSQKAPMGHPSEHSPQFIGSVLVSVQVCEQMLPMPPSSNTHIPLACVSSRHCPQTQLSPRGQEIPHPPQFELLLSKSTHIELQQMP
jgi:hypothetical protein